MITSLWRYITYLTIGNDAQKHENSASAMPTNLFLARPNTPFNREKILSITHLLP
jgi:hypothetical protein